MFGWMGAGGTSYKSWFELPDDQCAAVSYVFNVLEGEVNKLKQHAVFIPTLVIYAVDSLAKTNSLLFEHLVHTERVMNDGILNIVMVSSEGRV